ncbi:hypothetical protein WAI453_005128 [Rhynchosporium graminicola]
MDPTSSSPTLGVEFGLLPHTPASSRSKKGRSPNTKENTQSGGSLHKRFLNTIRGRSRSPKCASEDDSPGAKPVRRRKSIVDLLNFSSRESRDERSTQATEQKLNADINNDKEEITNIFWEPPKRRRSLGNLLNPANILGTVTNRVSLRSKSPRKLFTKEDIWVIRNTKVPEHKQSEASNEVLKHHNEAPKTDQHGDGPFILTLAEGSETDIDLFESRLARILDSIAVDDLETISSCKSDKLSLKMLQAACSKLSGNEDDDDKIRSCSPNSLRPVHILPRDGAASTSHSGILVAVNVPREMRVHFEEQNCSEEKRPNTPDSYLRLLIEASGEPLYYEQLRSSSSSVGLTESSAVSCYDEGNADSMHGAIQQLLDAEEADASSEQRSASPELCDHQPEMRNTTPDSQSDEEGTRQDLLDSRPIITVREVSSASTLIDLDPEFNQRQVERAIRYADLELPNKPDWKCIQAEIDRNIALTVAKMTRNYHSACKKTMALSPAEETTQAQAEMDFNIRCCGSRFGFDQEEAWDSVMTGKRLLLQGESYDETGMIKLNDATRIGTPVNEISLLDFHDLYTVSGGSSGVALNSFSCTPSKHLRTPSVDQVLQDSSVLRSPLDPFYATRKCDNLDFPLSLDSEVDFSPAYERFLRRTFSVIDPVPSSYLVCETMLQPEPHVTRTSLPGAVKSGQFKSTTFQVRYPSTVNLHHHTESFSSMNDVIQGLCDYKLGDLANFFVYDEKLRIVDAHSIDSPVPSPAELMRKGLQLCWIPHMFNAMAMKTSDHDSAKSGILSTTCGSIHGDVGIEEIDPLDRPIFGQSDQGGRQNPSEVSIPYKSGNPVPGSPSVFSARFFLADQQDSDFSGASSVADHSSALGALRTVAVEEHLLSSLDYDDEVQPTKTWVELAREAKTSNLFQDPSSNEDDEKASSEYSPLAMPSFDELEMWSSQAEKERRVTKGRMLRINHGYAICVGDGQLASLESSVDSDSGSDGLQDETKESTGVRKSLAEVGHLESFIRPHTVEPPNDSHPCKDDMHCISIEFAAPEEVEDEQHPRQNSVSIKSAASYASGFHFTAVQEHMMRESKNSDRGSDSSHCDEENIEDLYEAVDYNGADNDLYSSDEKAAVSHLDRIAKAEGAEDSRIFPLSKHSRHPIDLSYKNVLELTECNDLKHPTLDFTTKRNTSYNATKELEKTAVPRGEITFEHLNLRPVGKAAKLIPPAKKGKSKVGSLVNMFQDHGLMPEKSRGNLPISSIAPAFSRQTTQYRDHRGESSEASADSSTVRGVSATLPMNLLSVSQRTNRVVSPYSTFERPHSSASDIDTEASIPFGEVLRRTKKHGESEDEETSVREAELYG